MLKMFTFKSKSSDQIAHLPPAKFTQTLSIQLAPSAGTYIDCDVGQGVSGYKIKT